MSPEMGNGQNYQLGKMINKKNNLKGMSLMKTLITED